MTLSKITKAALSCGLLISAVLPMMASAQVVKIGVPLELSGRLSGFGAQCKNGIDMAADAMNAVGGHTHFEFVFRDIQSDPQATVSAVTQLQTNERVDYMIGPLASQMVSATVPAWRQTKPIWLLPGGANSVLEKEVGEESNFFHLFPYAYEYMASLSEALKHYLGARKRVAIISSDDSYGSGLVVYARTYLTSAGFEIVADEVVRTGSSDLNPTLSKIGRVKPDVLVGLVQGGDAINLAKQIHTRRLDVPYLVGGVSVQLVEWRDAVGEAQDGWIGISSYIPGTTNWPSNPEWPQVFPQTRDWETKFSARYGVQPPSLSILCYTAAGILTTIIGKVGDDKEKVAQALRTLNMPTVLGSAKFAPTPGGTKQQAFSDMTIFQRQGGKDVILYPVDQASGAMIAIKR